MIKKHKNKAALVRQNGEIYDVLDLQLALLDLNEHGFDLDVSFVDGNGLLLTCKKLAPDFRLKRITECFERISFSGNGARNKTLFEQSGTI